MTKSSKDLIKNWKPYDNAFELTSNLLDQINRDSDPDPNFLDQISDSSSNRYTQLLYNLNLPLNLRLYKGNSIPPDLKNELFQLLKDNMKSLYDLSSFYGGWDDKKKLSELTYYRTHIIAIFNDNFLIGFSSYRYIIMRENQDPTPVLYIYELQFKGSFRGFGLGQFFIFLLQLIARLMSCNKLMCTVLKSNSRALSFYLNKCNFVSDESDPDTEYRVLKYTL